MLILSENPLSAHGKFSPEEGQSAYGSGFEPVIELGFASAIDDDIAGLAPDVAEFKVDVGGKATWVDDPAAGKELGAEDALLLDGGEEDENAPPRPVGQLSKRAGHSQRL